MLALEIEQGSADERYVRTTDGETRLLTVRGPELVLRCGLRRSRSGPKPAALFPGAFRITRISAPSSEPANESR